jgi:hypothetical protein
MRNETSARKLYSCHYGPTNIYYQYGTAAQFSKQKIKAKIDALFSDEHISEAEYASIYEQFDQDHHEQLCLHVKSKKITEFFWRAAENAFNLKDHSRGLYYLIQLNFDCLNGEQKNQYIEMIHYLVFHIMPTLTAENDNPEQRKQHLIRIIALLSFIPDANETFEYPLQKVIDTVKKNLYAELNGVSLGKPACDDRSLCAAEIESLKTKFLNAQEVLIPSSSFAHKRQVRL